MSGGKDKHYADVLRTKFESFVDHLNKAPKDMAISIRTSNRLINKDGLRTARLIISREL